MSQKITFYPLGNAETCLLELDNEEKILFDFANMRTSDDDERYDIVSDLSEIETFKIVMFSHAHEDHVKGAKDFFYLKHAQKYQDDYRPKIQELWVSSAFILDTDLENQSDAKVIRNEARYRLREGKGIKVFAEPTALDDWLEEQNIKYEDVKDCIVHAGTKLSISDEMEIFVHAPFSNDSEEVEDKNDPSIVIQVRIKNTLQETNILITGDTKYQTLDKIVEITKENSNDEYLKWDIYDIPHHCSHTGLNEKDVSANSVVPTDNVQWLLSQATSGAVMIASCKKITEETSPPHLIAKEAYIKYTADDVDFVSTMEYIPKGKSIPSPIVIQIDNLGITFKKNEGRMTYFTKSAPRAGE